MEIRIFEDFEVMDGKEKIMLSAPHGFVHMREGNIKYAETNTNKICTELAEELNSYAIYKFINSDKDANYDVECDYKKECLKTVKRSKIKLLIDFHGMAMEREQDICLGIADGELLNNDKEFIDFIVEAFRKEGFKNVAVDNPFNAKRAECVSNFIHREANIPTMQIEINGKYRLPESPDYNIEGVKKAVKSIIKYFNKTK